MQRTRRKLLKVSAHSTFVEKPLTALDSILDVAPLAAKKPQLYQELFAN
jgi:hypothetical protein